MDTLIEYFLHSDRHLAEFAALYGLWIYVLLFSIVFAETGLIVAPFLPGDSLLFAAGTLAALGGLDLAALMVLLSIAAILGDALNYALGRAYGPRLVDRLTRGRPNAAAMTRRHLDQAHAFFERYGGKAVVLGRFAPFVRTFVPFVAGAARMRRPTFAFYNVTGGIVWVITCVGAGYSFGTVGWVRENFSFVALGIVAVSLVPAVAGLLRRHRAVEARA
ncbi:MAG TPA: VTT domain-containing protein [Vicinamibacterales bacterium]|nr:VTT domain-containing protein [Vicinamibacterales bacterium]